MPNCYYCNKNFALDNFTIVILRWNNKKHNQNNLYGKLTIARTF
jgi:hypothetical protein